MKLSGHSYSNNVFESLLNGISGGVEKQAQQSPISGMDMFSSTTENDLFGIQEEHLQTIAGELEFAADRSNVDITKDHLNVFAKEVIQEGLRGKQLERAAQKFCNKISHLTASPIGDTRNTLSSDLLDNANASAVVPAGYNTQYGQNDTTTAGYMGMSKNPNTIWDSGQLEKSASIPTNDEVIKSSKEDQVNFAKSQKQQYWENLQAGASQDGVIHEKAASVTSVATKESSGTQKLPENAMSVLSEDRDFTNIPNQTVGETIKEAAEERSTKKEASKDEWNKSVPSMKVNARSSVDKIFEGLADHFEGK